jgi:hypothetical protein
MQSKPAPLFVHQEECSDMVWSLSRPPASPGCQVQGVALMAWTARLDDVEPCNGDVLVRTSKGRLVAVIYAAGSEAETMRRVNSLLLADPANLLCSWCEGNLAPEELCACNTQEAS